MGVKITVIIQADTSRFDRALERLGELVEHDPLLQVKLDELYEPRFQLGCLAQKRTFIKEIVMSEDKRLERLPKWARMEIIQLRRDNVRLKSERNGVQEKHTNIRYWVSPDIGDPSLSLPNNARFEFFLPLGGRVDVQLAPDHLSVSASDGRIVVRPGSSNVISVMVEN